MLAASVSLMESFAPFLMFLLNQKHYEAKVGTDRATEVSSSMVMLVRIRSIESAVAMVSSAEFTPVS